MKAIQKLLLGLALLLTCVCFGQLTVTNTKTDKHVNVKGTQVFLQPPAGFDAAANFLGFQNAATGASIIVVQMSGPYEEITKGFTLENMKGRAMTLLKKETAAINGRTGLLLTLKQFSPPHGYDFLKYTLVLKLAPKNTLLVNGQLPASQKAAAAEAIRKSLLSVYYDSTVAVDALSTLDFTVNPSGTGFKISDKAVTGSLILEGPNGELMLIAKTARPLNAADKKGSSLASLKALRGLTYLGLTAEKEVKIDGAEGYQIAANVKDDGKTQTAVQAVLFGENHHYTFLAFLPDGNTALLADFETILKSFKRK